MSIFAVGLKKLRKIQLGRETTAGTLVAATTIWRGPGTGLEDQRETVFVEEDVGTLSGLDRAYTPKLLGAISFDGVPATFEQVLHILEAGIKTATPAADGSGSGHIYAYAAPVTSQNTIKTYTVEAGDNVQEEEIGHAFVSEFTLGGKGGEALMMSANWMGQQVAAGTFTTTPTMPTVEEILFSKGKLYIDATTIGTTLKSDTLLAAELSVTTGWTPVFTADGNLYFSGIKNVGPEVTLKLTCEHNSAATTEKTAWRNRTRRLIRLLFQGNALTTAGTTYTYKTLQIDLGGKYESVDVLGEQDGNDILDFTFRARPASAASTSKFCAITVVNELASVP